MGIELRDSPTARCSSPSPVAQGRFGGEARAARNVARRLARESARPNGRDPLATAPSPGALSLSTGEEVNIHPAPKNTTARPTSRPSALT